jgi:hypothetical protein
MNTAQRWIFRIAIAVLIAMFLIPPVKYSGGFDLVWHNPPVDTMREARHLEFWILGTVTLLFLTIPSARRR